MYFFVPAKYSVRVRAGMTPAGIPSRANSFTSTEPAHALGATEHILHGHGYLAHRFLCRNSILIDELGNAGVELRRYKSKNDVILTFILDGRNVQ